ncbi:hypothetical protein GCM10009637_16740 [Brevibacterium luteolum]
MPLQFPLPRWGSPVVPRVGISGPGCRENRILLSRPQAETGNMNTPILTAHALIGIIPVTGRAVTLAGIAVGSPARSAAAASIGLLLVAPPAGLAMVLSPVTMATMPASVVLGALIVRASLSLTRPLQGRMALAAWSAPRERDPMLRRAMTGAKVRCQSQ